MVGHRSSHQSRFMTSLLLKQSSINVIPGVISYFSKFSFRKQSNTDINVFAHILNPSAMSRHYHPIDSVTQCSQFYPTTQARRGHMLVTCGVRASYSLKFRDAATQWCCCARWNSCNCLLITTCETGCSGTCDLFSSNSTTS